jgi:two-component system, chemotaxis family, CheB/CheR fusion protein
VSELAGRVLIVAPLGRDASVMASLLAEHGCETSICNGAREARSQLALGAGALILTEEALEREHMAELFAALEAQPPWSELPLIVLTGAGESRFARLLELLADAAGSITVLERPIGTLTLVRSVQVALRSRRRQYQVRDLLEAQARLAAIVSSSGDAILSEDLGGHITSWNCGAERLYGYSASEMIGRPVLLLTPAELRQDQERVLLAFGRREVVDAYETVHLKKDGTRVHVSLGISPILDAEGAVVGVSKIARDITELVHARSIQRALTERLQDSDRRKNEFLATLAHELRNPLAPIRSAAQLLAGTKLQPEQLKWSREVIQRQVAHMARLLEDLLDVARVTHGKLSLKRSNVSLSTVVEAAVEAAQPSIAAKGHQLLVRLPAHSIELYGDAIRLAQIFGNLLTNAAKYTPAGGRIELTATTERGRVKVAVRDNGIGISADSLASIFEIFAQASAATGHAQGGLGIGLSLAKALAELHGGSISVTSELDRGSEFTVTLPLAAPAEQSPASLHGPAPGEARRVLIVDDNRDAADLLAALLRAEGHAVASAYSGEQALASAATFHPDIALLDLGMPQMNGYELARRIREEPWGRAVRLVALTGWGQADDRRRTLDSGFECHLVKPVALEDIHTLLARSSEQRPASA